MNRAAGDKPSHPVSNGRFGKGVGTEWCRPGSRMKRVLMTKGKNGGSTQFQVKLQPGTVRSIHKIAAPRHDSMEIARGERELRQQRTVIMEAIGNQVVHALDRFELAVHCHHR